MPGLNIMIMAGRLLPGKPERNCPHTAVCADSPRRPVVHRVGRREAGIAGTTDINGSDATFQVIIIILFLPGHRDTELPGVAIQLQIRTPEAGRP